MTIQQLTILVENRSNSLQEILDILRDNNVQLIATSLSDTADYGFFRIICAEPLKAYESLKSAGLSVNLNEVLGIVLTDHNPGGAAAAVSNLTKEGIAIRYIYSFLSKGFGILILSTHDECRERASDILSSAGLTLLNNVMLEKM
jgi:hypothetical protein